MDEEQCLPRFQLSAAPRETRVAPGALNRLTVLAEILRFAGVELVDLPRADTVVADVPPHRRLEIAHDDPGLQRLVEDRLTHPAMG
jgi:hypothetical protein